MNIMKVLISIVCIGFLSLLVRDKTTREERSMSEIAYSILFAAWILSGRL